MVLDYFFDNSAKLCCTVPPVCALLLLCFVLFFITRSFAIKKKDEIERVAKANR